MSQDEIFRIACENALHMQQEASKIVYATAADRSIFEDRPSTKYRPSLSIDGDHWCASYGEMPDGVQGFGKSPELAMEDFDKQWRQVI